jgi:hypothetical protein
VGSQLCLRSSSSLRDLEMSIQRFIMLSAAALAVSVSSAYAGPCSREMTRRCRPACAVAASWSLPQSVGAMMHHQPTRASVGAAEKRLASMARCRSDRLCIRH